MKNEMVSLGGMKVLDGIHGLDVGETMVIHVLKDR